MSAEEREQNRVADWLDRHGVLWCHVPNGGARNVIAAARLKRMGTKPGVPDILVFDPPPEQPAVGCAVELKAGKGRATGPQRDWLLALRQRGWLTFVATGAGDAIARLTVLGYGARR